MYRRGIVDELDPATHRARVKFPDRQGLVSGWLDVLVAATHGDKAYGLPAVGTQVACMMDEKDEDGCVVGALYSQVDAPPANDAKIRRWSFEDGGLVEYDQAAHVFRVTVPTGGKLELAGTAEPIALGNKTKTELDKIKDELDALGQKLASHMHPTAGTGPPSTPAPGSTTTPGYSPGSVGSAQARSA